MNDPDKIAVFSKNTLNKNSRKIQSVFTASLELDDQRMRWFKNVIID
jgi:hypothetical protein